MDIARHCGVSRAAVARVLLGSGGSTTRVSAAVAERIRVAAEQLHYVPNRHAQTLRGKGSGLFGVVMDWETAPSEYRRVAALERLAHAQGFQMLVGRAPHFEQAAEAAAYLNGFLELGVEALLLMDRLRDRAGDPVRLDWSAYPRLVAHGEAAQVACCAGVLPGVAEGSRLAAEHLLRAGRQRIGVALLGGPLTAARRMAGVRAAFQAEGRALPDTQVWFPPTVDGSQVLTQDGIGQMVRALVDGRHCDALIVENDHWAARTIRELAGRGIAVPAAVAVIGYGNLELSSYTTPAITTVDEADEVIAGELLARMLAVTAGRAVEPHQIEVLPNLVIRESA